MAVLDTYTAAKSIETGSTGPHADASELNPFTEQTADKLQKGFEMASSDAERYDQKKDAMWAFNQSIQMQSQWRKNVTSYTDPDAFQADINANQQAVMGTAPSGRASDMLVEHMAQFSNRMTGRVIYQKVAADKQQAAAEYKSGMDELNIQTALLKGGVQDARAADKAAAKLAKGLVPQNIIDTISGNTQAALDRTEISNVSQVAGSATAADKIQDGSLGKNLTPHENESLLNQYKLQGDTDLNTAQVNGKNFYQTQLRAIQSGQLYTKPEQDQALARVMAASSMKKDGSNAGGLEAKFFEQITDAKNEGVMRTKLLGMDNSEKQAYVSGIVAENGEGSKYAVVAQKIQKQFEDQIGKDPMQYAFNSQVFNNKYSAALQGIDAAKQSNDSDKLAFAQSNLKDAITAGLAIQEKGGVPQDKQTVMTVPEAKQYSSKLLKGSPQDAVKAIDDLKSTYGDYFPKVMNQLNSLPEGQRVPAQYNMLADHDMNENVRNTLVSAFQTSSDYKRGLNQAIIENGGSTTGLDKEIGKQMEPFSNALGITPTGSKSSVEYAQGVSTYAKALLLGNPDLKPEEAAQKAYEALIGSRYDTTNLNGRNTLLPRTDDQGQTIGQDQMDRMKDNLNYQHFMIGTGRQDVGIDYARLVGKSSLSPNSYDTPIPSNQQQAYSDWMAKQTQTKGYDANLDKKDYDMQGYFMSGQANSANGHATDEFKKPNHPTFSDESKYSNSQTPGGSWKEVGGKTYFQPSQYMIDSKFGGNTKKAENFYNNQYFPKADPSVGLMLPGPEDQARTKGSPGDVADNVKGQLQAQIFKSGNWVLTPDEKNLQLVLNNQNTRLASALGSAAPSSGVKYVYNTNGNPVQIPVSSLNGPSFVWGQQTLDNTVDEFKGMSEIVVPRVKAAAKGVSDIIEAPDKLMDTGYSK